MMKEYMKNNKNEEDKEIAWIEEQMQKYETELDEAEKKLERLHRQEDAQTNIFSPRAAEHNIEEEIELAADHVLQIKQKISSVREKLEDQLQKNGSITEEEIHSLEHDSSKSIQELSGYIDRFVENLIETDSNEVEKNIGSSTIAEVESESISTVFQNIDSNDKTLQTTDSEKKAYVKNILSQIYSKTELCLAFLKSDRNRCKRELQEIRRIIKNCTEELED